MMSSVHLRFALCSLTSVALATAWNDAAAAEPPATAAPVSPPDSEPPEPPTQADEGDETTSNGGMKDPVVEARLAYERGRDLYDQGRYEEALGAFLDAQRLFASPDHHHNIGRCYEALGRNELAMEYYRAYLRSDPPDRANIQNKIDRLERLQKIEANAAGNDAARTQTPPPGDEAPTETDEAKPEDATPTTSVAGRPWIISGGVLLGAGTLLALGGGIGFGVVAGRRSDEVREVFDASNPQGLTREETRSADEAGQRAETAQIVTAVVGGAVAATGAALLIVGIRKKRAASSRPTVSMYGTPSSAGVVLGGRF